MKSVILSKILMALEEDVLEIEDLENFCNVVYKMGMNPLPILRKWFKAWNIDIHVVFSEQDSKRTYDNLKRYKAPCIVVKLNKSQYNPHVDFIIVVDSNTDITKIRNKDSFKRNLKWRIILL